MKEIIRRRTLGPGLDGQLGPSGQFVEVWATRRHHDYLRVIQLQGFHYFPNMVRRISGLLGLFPVHFRSNSGGKKGTCRILAY